MEEVEDLMTDAPTLLDLLPTESIVVRAEAADWRDAIQLAGKALVAGGSTTDEYIAQMIRTVEDLGPYMVIAPGLALAHARPSPAVLRTGLSWVGLSTPVDFGSRKNDPVHLVIGLAAQDHSEHLRAMSSLARLVSDPDRLRFLVSLESAEAVRSAIETYERTIS